MSRDRVKDGVAEEIAKTMPVLARVLEHRLANYGVVDIEAQKVSDLETQLRVRLQNHVRYFVVKVSEKF